EGNFAVQIGREVRDRLHDGDVTIERQGAKTAIRGASFRYRHAGRINNGFSRTVFVNRVADVISGAMFSVCCVQDRAEFVVGEYSRVAVVFGGPNPIEGIVLKRLAAANCLEGVRLGLKPAL